MGGQMGGHRKPVTCSMCNGTGKVLVSKNGDKEQEERTCSRCNGSGVVR
jgi:DnaJ-class molecular chaperone